MRGLGSRNLASKTFLALAREAASPWLLAPRGREAALAGCGSAAISRAGRGLGAAGAKSSVTISSGAVISGSLSRVMTFLRSGADASTAPPAFALSPRARRCASSLALSAFLSASSSRLMGRGASTRRPAARRQRRLELARVGLGEEVLARQLAGQPAEVAVEARVLDDGRAQEDDELGLAAEIAAVGEYFADDRDAADSWNAGIRVLDDVLHQAREHTDLPALQPQHGVELARLEDWDHVGYGVGVARRHLQRRVRVGDRVDAAANRGPHVEHDGLCGAHLRQHRH